MRLFCLTGSFEPFALVLLRRLASVTPGLEPCSVEADPIRGLNQSFTSSLFSSGEVGLTQGSTSMAVSGIDCHKGPGVTLSPANDWLLGEFAIVDTGMDHVSMVQSWTADS